MTGLLLFTISGATLLEALIWLVIGGVIFWIVSWGIAYIGVPEPFNKVIRVILVIVVVVFCVNALLLLIDKPLFKW
jgi:hypothetical protein